MMSALRGPALALLVVTAALALETHRVERNGVSHDRFDMPGFDSYVYVAMAVNPSYFSVGPWGYRILTPSVVHALFGGKVVRGFRLVTLGGLGAAGVLLFLYLRRLGHGEWPSLLAVAAFCFSQPVTEALRHPVLVEPLTLALEVALLLALESGVSAPVLALVAVTGALSKEIMLALIPVVYFARREQGDKKALLHATIVAAPAILVTLALRLWWAPHVRLRLPGPVSLEGSWGDWLRALSLAGLVPLAALGAFRRQARGFLRRYGWVLVVTLGLPLLNPYGATTSLLGTMPRLLLYTLPCLLPLCLLALDRVWPHTGAPQPATRVTPRAELAALGAAIGLVLSPFVFLDRYRRIDLQGPLDGPRVLALCQESLRTARQLAQGRTVVWNPEERRFVWGVSDPGDLAKMRWFLWEGWGNRPHEGVGDIVMEGQEASLLVPTLGAEDLEVTLSLDAPRELRLEVLVNGRPLDTLHVDATPRPKTLRIPGSLLFRGDNVLTLLAPERAAPRARLVEIALHG